MDTIPISSPPGPRPILIFLSLPQEYHCPSLRDTIHPPAGAAPRCPCNRFHILHARVAPTRSFRTQKEGTRPSPTAKSIIPYRKFPRILYAIVGASTARPAVKCFVFAEIRCESAPCTARTCNARPYVKFHYPSPAKTKKQAHFCGPVGHYFVFRLG